MKTIYKYPLKVTDAQRIQMPKGAKLLCVKTQNNFPCLWAEVDNEAEAETRVIEIFGTGNPMWVDMGVERDYIGTVQCQVQGGELVWHVYEARL